LPQDRPPAFQVQRPFRRQRQPAGGALQQLHPQPCFKLAQAFAHRRQRQAEVARHFGQTAACRHLLEETQVIDHRHGLFP